MDPSRWDKIRSLFFRKDLSGRSAAFAAADQSVLAQVRRLQAFADSSSLSLISEDSADLEQSRSAPIFENGAVVANRFQVNQILGRGGMGEVYEAVDKINGSRVAIKVLRDDIDLSAQATERLLRREFLLSQRISHPNICRVNDLYLHESDKQSLYVVSMELVAGRTLAEIFADRGRLPIQEVAEIARQLTAGVEAAHRVGIVHRDLKPSNVMIVDEPAGKRVVITDFGLARSDRDTASNRTNFRGFAGTLRYMAPEQIEGVADFRADIYSVSLILYEILTGGFPFSGATGMAVALNRLANPPRDPAHVFPETPLNWRMALLKGLARNPTHRFQRIAELAGAIETPASTRLRLRWIYRQLRVRWVTAVAPLALLAVGIAAVLLWPSHSAPVAFHTLLFAGLAHAPASDPVVSGAELSLLTSLRQSPHLSVSTTDGTAATFRRMGKSDLSKLQPEDFRQAALRTGNQALLTGTISKDGEYRLHLQLQSIDTNPAYPAKTVDQDFAAADAKDMFRAVEDASQWVRKLSGESPRELFEQNTRPADLTTGSWDALHLLEEARLRRTADDPVTAITFLEEALSIDPGFAAAESMRGDILAQLHKYREGIEAHKHALALVKLRNITGRERFQIETAFNSDIGDDSALEHTYREWIAHFPNDYLPRFSLAKAYYERGDFQHALLLMQSAQRLAPNEYVIYPHLAQIYLAQGQTDKAFQCATRLRLLGELNWASEVEGIALAAQTRFTEAATRFQSILDKDSFWQHFGALCLANVLTSAGRLSEAEKVLHGDESLSEGKDALAERTLGIAYLRWMQNDFTAVKTLLPPILTELDTPETLAEAGALLARSGDKKGARRALALLTHWPEVPFQIQARERLQAELSLAIDRTKARRIAEWLDGQRESPEVWDLHLYAANRASWPAESQKVRRAITQRPSRLLNWRGWGAVPGLYRLALCGDEPPNSPVAHCDNLLSTFQQKSR